MDDEGQGSRSRLASRRRGRLTSTLVAAAILLPRPTRADISYGPWIFADQAFGDDALQLEPGGVHLSCGATSVANALAGFSPAPQLVNIGDAGTANDFAIVFTDLLARNDPGPDAVFFETRYSSDPYEIAVRPLGGSWTAFVTHAIDDFVDTGETACEPDVEVWGTEIDLDDYGLASGAIVDAIRFRALRGRLRHPEGDPTMAAVLHAECSALDTDLDGVPDGCDNCPEQANASQANADGDALGDECDCAPLDGRRPLQPEIDGVRVGRFGASGASLTWNSQPFAETSRVFRGFASPGIPFPDAIETLECIDELPAPGSSAIDDRSRPGCFYWYLVTANCRYQAGTLGRTSRGDLRYSDLVRYWAPPPCGVPPRDGDRDRVEDAVDLCPGVADPLQQDSDADGCGDACDSAPADRFVGCS